jgi:hypothetical protein
MLLMLCVTGRGSGFVAVEIPFTPRAKRVLELSLEEARQLGDLQPVLFILTPAYKFHQLCRFLLLPHLHIASGQYLYAQRSRLDERAMI